MGATDTFSAYFRCYHCGAQRPGLFNSTFLRPEPQQFHRHFTPGDPHPIAIPIAELATGRRWGEEFFPVSPWDGGPLGLLADFAELLWCKCGVPLLPRFSLTLEPATATLLEIATWPLLSETDLALAHFTDVWPSEWRFNPDGSYTWATQTSIEVRLARVDALSSAQRVRSIHRHLVLSALESHAQWRAGVKGLSLRKCLWCAPSWKAWIGEVSAEESVLVADFGGTWRLVRGPLDDVLASVPSEQEFSEAVHALRTQASTGR